MKSIGFNNFRRFVEFPKLDIGEITLLVGKNNAGKSTFIKAIQLVSNYLNNNTNGIFSFVDSNIEGSNIITFDRALCNHQKDLYINFKSSFNDYHISLIVVGDKDKQMINGRVSQVSIEGIDFNFYIDYLANTVRMSCDGKKASILNELTTVIDNYSLRINILKEELKRISVHDDTYINMNSELKRLNQQRRQLKKKFKENIITGFDITIDQTDNWHTYDLSFDFDLNKAKWIDVIKMFLYSSEIQLKELNKLKRLKKSEQNRKEQFSFIVKIQSIIEMFANTLHKDANSEICYYWKSESRKQSSVLSTKDNGNALVTAVHEYYQSGINIGNIEHVRILEWMKLFEVGVDFEIIPFGGEAYLCKIIETKGSVPVFLSDKGMGSIQIMTLLFKLATVIRNKACNNPILIIEEPELNLHPALQSNLADLFYNVNKEFGIKFVIETHSEYLVRKSQVLVAEKNYKDEKDLLDGNNFIVYYFPANEHPYSMDYLTSGRFEKKFEKGFFDEAAMATLTLSKIEIERRKISE